MALDLARAARLSHACPRQLPRHACWLERCTGGTRAPAGSAVEDAHGPQQGLQALLNPTDVHTASQLHVRPVTATARASCAGKRSSRTEQARLQGRRVQRVRGRAEDVDQRAPRQPQARDQAPLRLPAPPAALSAARANQDAAGVTAPHSHCPFSCCLLLTLAACGMGTLGLCHGLHPRACQKRQANALRASTGFARADAQPPDWRGACACAQAPRVVHALASGGGAGGRSRGAHVAPARPQAPAALSAAPPETAPAAAERQPHVPSKA